MPPNLKKLGPKTLAVLLAIAAINTAFSYYLLERAMRPAFQSLEQREAARNIERVRHALGKEVAHLATTAADWALWDNSYAFVQRRMPDLVEASILPAVLANLNIAFLHFFDAQGQPVFARALAPADAAEAPAGDFAPDRLLDPSLLPRTIDDERAGLLLRDGEALLVVAHPIADAPGMDAPAGTLLIGRPLDQAALAELRSQTQVDFRLLPLAAAGKGPLASVVEHLLAAGPSAEALHTVESAPDLLHAYALLDDVHGRPVMLLETALPRDIAAVGRDAIDLAIVLMVLAALLDLAVIWFLLQRVVIGPLRRLTGHIESAGRAGLPGPAVPLDWRRQDELGSLARSFDRLNAAMREQLAALNRAMERLHAADSAKTSFFANMSHELRTPLNAIIGFSELLRSEMFGSLPNQRYRDYIADINVSGHHLLHLVDQILDFSKADSAAAVLAREPVRLEECIDDALRMIRLQAERQGVHLSCEIEPGLPPLMGDRLRLSQILLNLLSNAVKFTDAGGRVTVSALRAPGGGQLLLVADTGLGMRPEEIPQALSPFVQLANAHARAAKGTGLGLPLAKRLAELHDARFELSSAPGQGTVVTIAFPPQRVEGHAPPPAASSAA